MQHLYESTVPLFTKSLTALSGILEKAEEHFPAELHATLPTDARLAPDMFAFVRQVQVACDNAKNGVGRLTGKEMPAVEDTEKSFADLRARVKTTLEILAHVRPEDFTDAENRIVELKYFPGQHMLGSEYAREYLVPNFFFHVAMAYAILRNAGMPLGKADYFGTLPLRPNL